MALPDYERLTDWGTRRRERCTGEGWFTEGFDTADLLEAKARLWQSWRDNAADPLDPMLALALRSRTYLGERCTCGVLTRCGMGYQAPQVVCNMARFACLPCRDPLWCSGRIRRTGGVLWSDPTRGGAAVTCKERSMRHACLGP